MLRSRAICNQCAAALLIIAAAWHLAEVRTPAAVTASLRIVAAISITVAAASNPVGALFAARRLASLLEELMQTAKISGEPPQISSGNPKQ